MAILHSPTEKGFDPRFESIDRCQIGLLRELAGQQGERLILKGGMAMRAVFGSLRLTKDIDFDRDPSLSQDALKKGLLNNLLRAAAATGIRSPKAEITKDTRTTVRARLQGMAGHGADVRFDVEVSGRHALARENIRAEIVSPPPHYGMAPFPVTTYTNEALAVMKIAAALSEQRHAPRDLYDLRDLIRAGVAPTALLAQQDAGLIQDFADRALEKLDMLSYALAQQELLPYLPQAERHALTEDAWIDATLMAAGHIVQWCEAALQRQRHHRGQAS
uniref:nucleotidyl transferase AbiEii/AbiGii toxin family protein n=1 Tax=Castellaniella defragrans TaxID=75697 RepID=UPI0033407022